LLKIQPQFRTNLLDGVAQFKIDLEKFTDDYTNK
jgi:hypothetical protein